jgi:hypothetical protein
MILYKRDFKFDCKLQRLIKSLVSLSLMWLFSEEAMKYCYIF